jgi:uncharacterized membrane protein YccC
VRFTRGNDFYSAGLATLRTTMTMASLAIFWIASAWPFGLSAMILATVFAGLFAAIPNPTKALGATVVGLFMGITASFICQFVVLPNMDGYGLFVAGCIPCLMVGVAMMAWPSLVVVGTGYTLGFAITLAAKNEMVFDIVHFTNDAIADLIGIGSAMVAFVFVPPTFGSPWFRRHQFELLRRQVSVAAEAPLPGLRHRFESVNHDLFGQIVMQTERGSKDSRALLAWALAVNETGRALIQLRNDMSGNQWSDDIRSTIAAAINALARLYDQPSAARYLQARDAIRVAIDHAGKNYMASPLLDHLNLLRMALLDEQSVLAEYMPPGTGTTGVSHAT